ncbi:nucleotidyltransferase family protein [Kineococcus sp. G2]|uniref:nucleotidyltransferase family protein n=1 Tax=Kineococcus sp. G2 TaxID=3127484 RepID=UPI00301B86BA
MGSRRAARAAGAFARAVLAGGAADPSGVDADALTLVARHHRVGPSLDHLLAGAPDPAQRALRAATRRAALVQGARQLTVQLDLRVVADALDGLPWAVLKGPAVAATLHGGAPREFHDLDVLVHPAAFGDALRALEARGARAMDPDWAGVRAARAGEIAVALPHGTFLDLHWHLVNRPGRRARFRVDVPGLLGRTRPAGLLGTPAPVLDADDQLHHLALHACLSGAWRLLWSYDLRLGAAAVRDWDVLVERCARAGTGLAVAMALGRARDVLGAPVPGAVLRALAGRSPWAVLGATATAVRPPHALTEARRNGAVLYTSAADGTAASARELVRALRARVAPPRAETSVSASSALLAGAETLVSAREGYLADVREAVQAPRR